MPEVMQQVLAPMFARSLTEGFSQLESYVVRAGDVVFAEGAAAVVEAFGYGPVTPAFLDPEGAVFVVGFPAVELQRFQPALGTTDLGPVRCRRSEWSCREVVSP